MKDKAKRDKQQIEYLQKDLQNRTVDNFKLREMLRNLYNLSAGKLGNELQAEANSIMMQDHFMAKQIPPGGHFNENE
jgi:hypothetical protein